MVHQNGTCPLIGLSLCPNSYNTYAGLWVWPTSSRQLAIRSVTDSYSNSKERSSKHYTTTLLVTRGNGIYTRALSHMLTIRKSVVQPDVLHSSLHCLAHLKCWPKDRRRKIYKPSRQLNNFTGGGNDLHIWCRKQARRWRGPNKNMKKILLRESGPQKKLQSLGVPCSCGRSFMARMIKSISWPQ